MAISGLIRLWHRI